MRERKKEKLVDEDEALTAGKSRSPKESLK